MKTLVQFINESKQRVIPVDALYDFLKSAKDADKPNRDQLADNMVKKYKVDSDLAEMVTYAILNQSQDKPIELDKNIANDLSTADTNIKKALKCEYFIAAISEKDNSIIGVAIRDNRALEGVGKLLDSIDWKPSYKLVYYNF